MEATPDAMIAVNASGEIVRLNELGATLFGYTKKELIGQKMEMLVPERLRSQHLEERNRYVAKPKVRIMGSGLELYGLHKDGSEFAAEIGLSPIETEEGTLVISVVRDITERKRAEEEHRKLEAKIQHSQKLESLGVLAGGIAHDFNNLLVGILGNIDLALMKLSPTAPGRQEIHDAVETAQRAANLCKELLAYSGKGRFVVQAVDVSKVVQEMSHLLEITISKKTVLKYVLAPDLPAIEADVTQIRQVVMNLITNAAEAVDGGKGAITVSTSAMNCTPAYLKGTFLDENQSKGRYVYFEVADNGHGMDEETKARIFDPFFTTKSAGRGLGLAAVLGIVRGHRGAIKVYSESGQGTTVKVLFPCTELPAVETIRRELDVTNWRGSGTVLAVDDEETILNLLGLILEEAGFKVLKARDGEEAVELYRRRADDITLVVLDMAMPRMNGEETFRELRLINPDVRVILSSGYNEQDATIRFVGKGLAAFIQKPYRVSDFLAKVRDVLER